MQHVSRHPEKDVCRVLSISWVGIIEQKRSLPVTSDLRRWQRLEKGGNIPKWKVILFSSLPVLLLALIVLVTAEVWLRTRYRTIASITGMNEWKEGTGNDLTFYWDKYHPTYGWTNLPGYRSDARVPFKVTINNQGLRGQRDYSLTRTKGMKRMAVLGDSFTFGEDVDDDQTLPVYLERMLKDAEVLNFGVHGHGLDEMTLRLEDVFAYDPDHILLVLAIPPDLERTVLYNYDHPMPAFTIEDGSLVAKNIPVPVTFRQRSFLRNSYLLAWLLDRPRHKAESDAMILRVSRELLNQAVRLCADRGIQLTVVLITGPSWIVAADTMQETADWMDACRRMVVATVADVSDQIDFMHDLLHREQNIAAREDIHWSGHGNCHLAERLAQELIKKRHGWKHSASSAERICP